MQGLYHQSNTMIWRDLVAPGYSMQPDNSTMDETGSESELDSEGSIISDFSDIDVNVLLGRAIVIWTYTKLDCLMLFTPRKGDSLFQVTKYAEINLDFDPRRDKIMVMDPGDKHPKDMRENFSLRPGSVVMIMPKFNVNVTVEINQLKSKFAMSADLMCTVYDVKSYIKRMKGVSVDQQDLLYRDKVMENSKRLFEYKLRNGTTIHVLLQVHFDLLVNVETFWGKTYRLYIDRCSTGSDLIYTIFGRTFSQSGQQQASVHELFVPIHVLLLRHHKRSIHWDFCLGYFGIRNGDTLVLSTVGRHSNLEMQNMTIVSELSESHEITVSKFDRWSVVGFILHGLTDVPVDMIRLFNNGNQVDFTSVIGNIPKNTTVVMNIVMNNLDRDISFGIPLKISIGNGIIEHIKIAPIRTVKDVKKRLENMGVPNATLYELTTGIYRLPKHACLQDVIMDLNKPLVMKVERFPVFIHAPDGIIYKTMVDVNHTFKDFKQKFEMKTGFAASACRMLIAGQDIRLPDQAILYDNGFSTRTSVFVESSAFHEVFFITNGDLLVKLKLPIQPTSDDIKRSIWAMARVPEGAITCLQTFFFWFFYPRVSRKYMLPRKRKTRKRLPIASRPHPEMSDRKPRRNGSYDDLSDIKIDVQDTKYLPTNELGNRSPTKTIANLQKPQQASKRKTSSKKILDQYDPGFNRSHPTRAKLHNNKRDVRSRSDSEQSRIIVHHVTPRWMGNLHQKEEAHRLLAMGEDGMAYRYSEDHATNPFIYTGKSKGKRFPLHNQGDASTARYTHKKQAYDKQQLMYGSSSDSDSDDGRNP